MRSAARSRGSDTGSKFEVRGSDMKIDARRAMIALLFVFGGGSLSGEALTRLAGEIDATGLREAVAREKGHVVLVNFWATWCVPCREEFPRLARLQERYRSADLRVVGVSTDFESQRAAVDEFLAQRRLPFPNYQRNTG